MLSSFLLPVDEVHRLYVETWGAPAGEPLLVLHGGPGSGCGPRLKELYDPRLHFVVLVDQRGAGRSLPAGETRANTPVELIADLERLRRHLGLARWRVTGGSWGATLALAYAAAHREVVSGVVVRSVFLPGKGNVDWFFQGLKTLQPAAWEALSAALPEAAGGDLLSALAARLNDADRASACAAALAWRTYEQAIAEPAAARAAIPAAPELDRLVAKYRLQAHYLAAGCFVDEEGFLDACAALAGLPLTLIHGRLDLACPPSNAERIHARIAGSRLVWVADCGHEAFHPAMVAAWRAALGAPPR